MTTLRVVVAPAPGRLRMLPPRAFRGGAEWVDPGQPVARLEQGAREIIVTAPIGGKVSAVLGLEGEPVATGQPVMAIDPQVEA